MEITLDSLRVHDELDPELWDNFKLKPGIRKPLLRIAAEFLITLGVDAVPRDVTVTGSLANFNYSPASDLDLHIIFDYEDIGKDIGMISEMLAAKKTLWNLKHNITVKSHEVEVYPQDSAEAHHSTGVYSLISDDWIVRPRPERPAVDSGAIIQKTNGIVRLINAVLSRPDRMIFIPLIREKISNMRKSGLSSGGEFSVENIVFKILRRHGYLNKLADVELHDRDASLTVAQEGNTVKVSKLMLAEILKEELAELGSPRHRGGDHERAKAGFEPPGDLLLNSDDPVDENDCDSHPDHHDNELAMTVSEGINSLASEIAQLMLGQPDVPDWVDFKLASSLTNLRDVHLYLKARKQ